MTRIKRFLLSLALVLGVSGPALVPAMASAQVAIDESLRCGANFEPLGSTSCEPTDSDAATSTVNSLVTTGLNILSAVVGIVSVIMIIIGGFKYITSGGDSGNVTSAKNTIMYAIIGLIIVALAQLIVNFVLDKIPA